MNFGLLGWTEEGNYSSYKEAWQRTNLTLSIGCRTLIGGFPKITGHCANHSDKDYCTLGRGSGSRVQGHILAMTHAAR